MNFSGAGKTFFRPDMPILQRHFKSLVNLHRTLDPDRTICLLRCVIQLAVTRVSRTALFRLCVLSCATLLRRSTIMIFNDGSNCDSKVPSVALITPARPAIHPLLMRHDSTYHSIKFVTNSARPAFFPAASPRQSPVSSVPARTVKHAIPAASIQSRPAAHHSACCADSLRCHCCNRGFICARFCASRAGLVRSFSRRTLIAFR